jgi:hypothetical protein
MIWLKQKEPKDEFGLWLRDTDKSAIAYNGSCS